jgi:carbamoyltransferase
MAAVLGINAVFHDPAAAIVVDGEIVAAAEEERFSRRKHGKVAVPFSTWELPERAMAYCLDEARVAVSDLAAIAYSYDPTLAGDRPSLTEDEWEQLRTLYAAEAPGFVESALGPFDRSRFCFVPHHEAHAASAVLAAPFAGGDVLVMDGRGERSSALLGTDRSGGLEVLATQRLPHSLGLFYEELTMHLGFTRSSDEYKVMALASYGDPRHLDLFRKSVRTDGTGGFEVDPVDFDAFAPRRRPGDEFEQSHADLAASVQRRLEEVIIELATWLQRQTGGHHLAMAGGVALNCVANSRLWAEGPYESVWVQPAAGDAGTALGAALAVARRLGDRPRPLRTAALGPCWSDVEVRRTLERAGVGWTRPADLSGFVAERLAAGAIVGWFEGRSEFGPRALGHRSLLADPRDRTTLERLNDVKGREQFRPVAPMVLEERASDIFEGPLPSPYMLFVHRVRAAWRDRIPATVHVDGSARAQTVEAAAEPKIAALLSAFAARTGVPVLVNTSFNTAGRPMVDCPADALEIFGSAPLELLVLGPFVVERAGLTRLPSPSQAA